MLLTRTFAHRRATLLGLAGMLVLATFVVTPTGQAFAASLLQFFRGQSIKAVPTDLANIKNAYETLYELDELGTRVGSWPGGLTSVSSVSQAASISKLSLAQPSKLPGGISSTPKAQAIAPGQVVLTLNKAQADAYFQSEGSSLKMPGKFNGAQIIVNFPGVALLEYYGNNGSRVYLGQAGQLDIKISVNNISVTEMRDFLLQMPGLSSTTASTLKNMTNWQTTIPLGIPTDKVGWSNASVSGSFAGQGVIINDNSGIGSALLWQASGGTRSIGLAGYGLKASDLQSIAGGLK
jgi:hypothetical protein